MSSPGATRRQIKEVAMREIRTRARSRGYRAITAIMLLLAIAAPIVMTFIPEPGDNLPSATIGLTVGAPDGLETILTELGDEVYELKFVDLRGVSQAEIDDELTNGVVDVAVESSNSLAWTENEDFSLQGLVTAGLNQISAIERAEERDISLADLADVFTPVDVSNRFVETSANSTEIRQGVAFFGLFLAFLLPQIFGQLTMLSVVEEKSTRVVEVLLSHIRPSTLLAGKILGLCALAVVQLILIVIGLVGSLLATKVVEVPASVWQFVPLMTISVLGGLAIYTTLFALLGSLISRQEDAAQVMMPVFAPLMVGYFAGQTAVFSSSTSLFIRILTWFPLTSPMLLPVRVAKGTIGAAEIVVSLGILAITVFLLLKLASRVYEFTLLRTGSRVGWGELFRLSRGIVVEG